MDRLIAYRYSVLASFYARAARASAGSAAVKRNKVRHARVPETLAMSIASNPQLLKTGM